MIVLGTRIAFISKSAGGPNHHRSYAVPNRAAAGGVCIHLPRLNRHTLFVALTSLRKRPNKSTDTPTDPRQALAPSTSRHPTNDHTTSLLLCVLHLHSYPPSRSYFVTCELKRLALLLVLRWSSSLYCTTTSDFVPNLVNIVRRPRCYPSRLQLQISRSRT